MPRPPGRPVRRRLDDRHTLRPGDVITRLGGTEITTITALAEALAARTPGEVVTVTYVRGTTSHEARVTLGEL
ncbi:PDZ domain-containing protein [Streptomyces sp. SP18ES09]|uniref:PDZ domain-containing protein n=1 Tax=Streptomyces sp. SP18ES09 TaxID=3002532 RepID=UPI002E766314|nr:PDZ domain-containing protein [Streptomyces sp. SP18ES09]MEE1813502.1 PDZ domain-containing protein [Streptomyces sp. SP18ES09]